MSAPSPEKNKNRREESPVRSRPSFREAIEMARSQIDLQDVDETDRDFARDIIAIIAEVYMLWDSTPVRIGADQADGYIVKQVFGQLRAKHVQLVMDNFRKIEYLVKNKKQYLRTSLYNAVFECEAHYSNLVRHDLGI